MSRLPAPDRIDNAYGDRPVALLAGHAGRLATLIAEALRAAGWSVHSGRMADLSERLDLVLLLVTEPPASPVVAGKTLTGALLMARDTQLKLEQAAAGSRAAFVTVTRLDGCLGLSTADTEESAVLGGLPGLVKTLVIEAPSLYCRALDLAPELSEERCAELLMAELHGSQTELTQVGYDADEVRRTLTLGQAPDPLLPGGTEIAEPGPDDLLVITGGGRGITAACAVGLARRYRSGLLLLGRTSLCDEPEWAREVPNDTLRASIAAQLRSGGGRPVPREVERLYRELAARREIRQTLADIRATGATAEYLSVDITDAAAVAAILAPHRSRITGLVHGAGVLADQPIVDKHADDVERVLAPKLTGLASVLAALDGDRLRHVVLFSSVAGFFGNRGQSDYAMANEVLNRMACVLKRRHPDASVTAINWGAWAGGMVTPELGQLFTARGVTLIPIDEGVRLFVEQFQPERSRDVVCVAGPTTPLSGRKHQPLPAGGLKVCRELGAMAANQVISDHAIGGVPVLPATAAIGAVLNAVGRIRPGVQQVREFSVLKGVVFDHDPGTLRLSLTERDGPDSVAVLAVDNADRPCFQAIVSSIPQISAQRLVGLPSLDHGRPLAVYGDGTLFHGPTLRGLRSLLASDERMVFGCKLADVALADGAYATETYSPVLADLLLQAALVWVRRHLGQASLPVAVGRIQTFAALPDDRPFLVVVEGNRPTGNLPTGHRARCTVTACSPDGQVLLRFDNVDLVCSVSLGDKFAANLVRV